MTTSSEGFLYTRGDPCSKSGRSQTGRRGRNRDTCPVGADERLLPPVTAAPRGRGSSPSGGCQGAIPVDPVSAVTSHTSELVFPGSASSRTRWPSPPPPDSRRGRPAVQGPRRAGVWKPVGEALCTGCTCPRFLFPRATLPTCQGGGGCFLGLF